MYFLFYLIFCFLFFLFSPFFQKYFYIYIVQTHHRKFHVCINLIGSKPDSDSLLSTDCSEIQPYQLYRSKIPHTLISMLVHLCSYCEEETDSRNIHVRCIT